MVMASLAGAVANQAFFDDCSVYLCQLPPLTDESYAPPPLGPHLFPITLSLLPLPFVFPADLRSGR